MKGGETVSLRKDKWVKQSSADWDVNLWAVDLCAVGVMKMLTVLISEAGGVECLAAGVDGSEQLQHRVCKYLLLSVLPHRKGAVWAL